MDKPTPVDEPANEAGAAANDAVESDASPPVSELEQAQKEIASLADKLLRARADYDNLVKRQQREATIERERVKARVVENFLQVYEYGRMAATEAEKHPGALAEGVKMIVREFDRLLEAEGVKLVGAIGEAFDSSRHEAVGEEPGEAEPGQITRIVQPGYILGERILRYAKVMVAPANPENPAS